MFSALLLHTSDFGRPWGKFIASCFESGLLDLGVAIAFVPSFGENIHLSNLSSLNISDIQDWLN